MCCFSRQRSWSPTEPTPRPLTSKFIRSGNRFTALQNSTPLRLALNYSEASSSSAKVRLTFCVWIILLHELKFLAIRLPHVESLWTNAFYCLLYACVCSYTKIRAAIHFFFLLPAFKKIYEAPQFIILSRHHSLNTVCALICESVT